MLTMLFALLSALVAPPGAADAQRPGSPELTEGRYFVTMDGYPISREFYEVAPGLIRLCTDYAGAGALVNAELEMAAPGRPTRYAATYDLAFFDEGGLSQERRSYGLRVEGDTLRWEAEEGGMWRERAVPWDPDRPLIVFQSALFALYGQFPEVYGDREGPLEVQGVVMEEAMVETWTIEREGDDLVVDSPQGIRSHLVLDAAGRPARVEIPEQEVSAAPQPAPNVIYPPLCSPPENLRMPSETVGAGRAARGSVARQRSSVVPI